MSDECQYCKGTRGHSLSGYVYSGIVRCRTCHGYGETYPITGYKTVEKTCFDCNRGVQIIREDCGTIFGITFYADPKRITCRSCNGFGVKRTEVPIHETVPCSQCFPFADYSTGGSGTTQTGVHEFKKCWSCGDPSHDDVITIIHAPGRDDSLLKKDTGRLVNEWATGVQRADLLKAEKATEEKMFIESMTSEEKEYIDYIEDDLKRKLSNLEIRKYINKWREAA
jgi:hypothetical protein